MLFASFVPRMENRPIVLSGGGARGAAHIGVLRALAENGIRPQAISATSAGALVGALVADGHAPEEVAAFMLKEVGSISFLRRPIPASKRIEQFLRRHLRSRRFEDLSLPLYVAATDLEHGGQHIIHEGELIPVLMAAMAIPVVFPAVAIEGVFHVDGGLSNNLPVEPFMHRKQDVIAVYVNPLPPFKPGRRSMIGTLDRVWHLNFREMVTRSAQGCHLFIEPPELSRFGLFDIRRLAQIEHIGYNYTMDLLKPR